MRLLSIISKQNHSFVTLRLDNQAVYINFKKVLFKRVEKDEPVQGSVTG